MTFDVNELKRLHTLAYEEIEVPESNKATAEDLKDKEFPVILYEVEYRFNGENTKLIKTAIREIHVTKLIPADENNPHPTIQFLDYQGHPGTGYPHMFHADKNSAFKESVYQRRLREQEMAKERMEEMLDFNLTRIIDLAVEGAKYEQSST